ncbi:4-phosphoerythronate dehydrogenase [Allohahella sp. A8]|uniref:4-phosphoerythronate dehydrogenase n=1 Tax=Allohahella sp. A8 TaxID=3141461 RepID=UPI000C0BA412|nr:erythronate-4-phosphate dehydrogenase [Hahellaceae bacterium]|tara:strand:- start:91012 stop:92259 length:1248 start_codon:yes stop_codon:yes gene_type:complete
MDTAAQASTNEVDRRLTIVADENMPLLEAFFASIGHIVKLPGRRITRQDLLKHKADILLVRSITPVNQALLEGTSVSFVGSATVGTDHIDTDWLEQAGIPFANSPGCNASAVVEYVLSAMTVVLDERDKAFADVSVGVIGCGHVGGMLADILEELECTVVRCDPPLHDAQQEAQQALTAKGRDDGRAPSQPVYEPMAKALECDFITLHVPLIKEGPYKTLRLLDADMLANLQSHQTLINTSRGQIIDQAALKKRLQRVDELFAVLDVFENEPNIDHELMMLCRLATPHIAGHSLDGKGMATAQVYEALSHTLGLPVRHKLGQFLPEPPLRKMNFSRDADPQWALHTAIRACYDIRGDYNKLRHGRYLPEEQRGEYFDKLRSNYRIRRSFSRVKVGLKGGRSVLQDYLEAVGFRID